MHEVVRQLLSYLRGMWQYRWYGVGVSWLVCIIGWVVVVLLPNQYEANARVYVDTQSVLKPLLAGLAVQPNVDQQITAVETVLQSLNLDTIPRVMVLNKCDRLSAHEAGVLCQRYHAIGISAPNRETLRPLIAHLESLLPAIPTPPGYEEDPDQPPPRARALTSTLPCGV